MEDFKAEAFHFPFVHAREFCELAINICFGFALAIVCYVIMRTAEVQSFLQVVLGLCALCDFGVACLACMALVFCCSLSCECGLRLDLAMSEPDKFFSRAISTVVAIPVFLVVYMVFVPLVMSASLEKLLFIGLGFFLAGIPFVLFLCSGRVLEFEAAVQSRCREVVSEGERENYILQYLSLVGAGVLLFLVARFLIISASIATSLR